MAKDPDKSPSQPESESPGRVDIDARGRNVWHWNNEQLDSTTVMLQSLQNDALELEPTRKVRAASDPGKDAAGRRRRHPSDPDASDAEDSGINASFSLSSRGFDPYNRS